MRRSAVTSSIARSIEKLLTFVLAGLIGYPLILFGRIKCLVNVPERCGAKWLMFICVLALIAGPAVGFVAGFFGAGQDLTPARGARKGKVVAARELEQALVPRLDAELLTKSYFWLNVGSLVLSLTSEVCFLLFLRSVANCFHSQRHAAMVDFYFILMFGILVTALYLVFGGPVPIVALAVLLLLGLALIGSVVWYLLLLGSVSWCITEGMEKLRPSALAPPPLYSAP